jgi:phosphatidylinositol 4-phosphatase
MEQKSVIRTNCMDCLDRTNVVQSAIARDVLTKQLVDCGIFKVTDQINMFPDFESLFRNSNTRFVQAK